MSLCLCLKLFSQRNSRLIVFVLEGACDGVDVSVEGVRVFLELGKEFGERVLGNLYDVSIHLVHFGIVLRKKELLTSE